MVRFPVTIFQDFQVSKDQITHDDSRFFPRHFQVPMSQTRAPHLEFEFALPVLFGTEPGASSVQKILRWWCPDVAIVVTKNAENPIEFCDPLWLTKNLTVNDQWVAFTTKMESSLPKSECHLPLKWSVFWAVVPIKISYVQTQPAIKLVSWVVYPTLYLRKNLLILDLEAARNYITISWVMGGAPSHHPCRILPEINHRAWGTPIFRAGNPQITVKPIASHWNPHF